MGLGMGASVLTSRYWGMRELNSLKKAVTIMLRLVLCLASAFTLFTIFAPGTIMRMYTPVQEIIDYGVTYLRWLLPTYLCIGLSVPDLHHRAPQRGAGQDSLAQLHFRLFRQYLL